MRREVARRLARSRVHAPRPAAYAVQWRDGRLWSARAITHDRYEAERWFEDWAEAGHPVRLLLETRRGWRKLRHYYPRPERTDNDDWNQLL